MAPDLRDICISNIPVGVRTAVFKPVATQYRGWNVSKQTKNIEKETKNT